MLRAFDDEASWPSSDRVLVITRCIATPSAAKLEDAMLTRKKTAKIKTVFFIFFSLEY